jgi:hypothetical protein
MKIASSDKLIDFSQNEPVFWACPIQPHHTTGRAKAQAVSRRPLTAESQIRARVNPCGICGGQSGTGTRFYQSSSVPSVNIIPSSFSILMYHPRDEQYVR